MSYSRSSFLNSALVCLLLSVFTLSAAYVEELKLPAGFGATSPISIVTHEFDAHLLYRGEDYGLVHVVMDYSGNVTHMTKLGGILLSGVTATATSLFASKLSMDVVYLTKNNAVAMRLYRNGAWRSQMLVKKLPARTVFQPALVPTVEQDGQVQLYMTALNRKVVMVRLRDGVVTSPRPVWFRKLFVYGAPTALNTYLPVKQGIQLYVREYKTGLLYSSASAKNQQVFKRVPHMYGLSSGVCAASIGEGGQIVIGKSFQSTPKGVAIFKHLDFEYPKHGDFEKSTWLTEQPGCTYWRDSCTLIFMNQGSKLLHNLYCN